MIDDLQNSTSLAVVSASFDDCEISEPSQVLNDPQVEQLADAVMKLNADADIFNGRSESSTHFLVSLYRLFVKVENDDEQWKHLCEMPVFKERSRMLGDDKRALAVMQFGANARGEKERKVCSREANVLLYAHKKGVSVDGFEAWLTVTTTSQAVAAMRQHRRGDNCNYPSAQKRANVTIPCDIHRSNYPHFDEACRKGLSDEVLLKITPILTNAFDEIERLLEVYEFVKAHPSKDDEVTA